MFESAIPQDNNNLRGERVWLVTFDIASLLARSMIFRRWAMTACCER
jgi:hypothetical protein